MEKSKGEKDRHLAIPEYLVTPLETWRGKRPKRPSLSSTLKGKKPPDVFSKWLKDMPRKQE